MNNSSGSNVNKHVDDKKRGTTHDIKSTQNSNVDGHYKKKSHKIKLTPPLFIEVPQLNQESEQILPLFTIFIPLVSGTALTVWHFLVFHFYNITNWINKSTKRNDIKRTITRQAYRF